MKKVELLAPAGSYESFLGAIHAGTDAVYIGGQKYGARAYAENFTKEEVCLAIRYAHLFKKKLYLTVNTLVREDELWELPAYIRPFYEEGLDGVIVQDFGVFALLREAFPGLELHGSTEMSVTGAYGARFLLEQGASRVVPARELSLAEIRAIKETGIEVEAFIHGAMCYCYSGQCLFSSMLGGRSGNRGRCAQPCRLPYRIIEGRERARERKESYPLSLKDMCTLPFLPELIEAGIDSFKIEGRMKRPEYAAGVTALYRKYIDRYYEAPEKPLVITDGDMEKLRTLYIRSEIQEGYYHRHNGREMITPDKPSYLGADETYLTQIRKEYLENGRKIPVCGKIVLAKDEPVSLELRTTDGGASALCYGQDVQSAQKQPLTREAVEKQLFKMGNTPYELEKLECVIEDGCFLPVKALNDLRRDAVCVLEEAMTAKYRRSALEHVEWERDAQVIAAPETGEPESGIQKPYFSVQIEREGQLAAACEDAEVDRLYLDADLLADWTKRERLLTALSDWKTERTERNLFLVLPYIIRLRDTNYLNILKKEIIPDGLWDGVMIRNLESLQWLREISYGRRIIADAGLYVWNMRAKHFLKGQGIALTAPLECNKTDWHKIGIAGMEAIVYGRSPLMITANCIRKTNGECPVENKKKSAETPLSLQDRYHTDFPVITDCLHCYNIIYNSLPLSLHEYGRSVMQEAPAGIRLSFTTESPREIRDVLACYRGYTAEPWKKRQAAFSYTKGHYKRGAQ
ncbi:MAG: U32 family peptidase [Lachnospiraceae bacterium]|nr:U32 family peptidase [Lachnospiraceae bacterium]